MANEVRICVCGDEGAGKSSLIAALVKNTFVSGKIQHVLPQITLPPTLGTPKRVTTVIVDTSARPQEREELNREIRKCNVVLLVYADHYSYERVGLFWLPHFRSLGVNVPIVLCANKADLNAKSSTSQVVEDEMLPLLTEFKEVDACLRTSAKDFQNVTTAFFLCQTAVIYPIAPLYDSKESKLKTAAVSALKRIFHLSDRDQDGYLDDKEMRAFSQKCFQDELKDEELENLKGEIQQVFPDGVTVGGLVTMEGFVTLNKIYASQGRHETVWIMLRAFHYADSLSLEETFIHPKLKIPDHASAELSPAGYQFLFDLFLLFDKDNDGGLNQTELDALFAPTPGLPHSWLESSFPASTVVNDSGHVTLQGWLAQWSMTTFVHPKTTLEYLAYLGYEPPDVKSNTTTALKVTKPRSRQSLQDKLDRSVVSAYLVGAPECGKSSLLDAFLSQRFSSTYRPTIKPRTAVNSVELSGGKQCYLIMEELGEREPAVLENKTKLDNCDLLIFAYDSSQPDSFAHIPAMIKQHPHLLQVPIMFVALKADQDKTNQRTETQPDEYAAGLGLNKPLHVSVTWQGVAEFFVQVGEAALKPRITSRIREEELPDRTNLYIAAGAGLCAAAAAFVGVYRQVR